MKHPVYSMQYTYYIYIYILQCTIYNVYNIYMQYMCNLLQYVSFISIYPSSCLVPLENKNGFLSWNLFNNFLTQQPPPSTPVGHGLLNHEVSRSRTTTHHSRQDSSGRLISSSQRPLPDNTQHSQQTSMPLVGVEPTISADELPQKYVLDPPATGTGLFNYYIHYIHS